jgi:hypothetical protein
MAKGHHMNTPMKTLRTPVPTPTSGKEPMFKTLHTPTPSGNSSGKSPSFPVLRTPRP